MHYVIGAYNGARGTIVGFVWKSKAPVGDRILPKVNELHALEKDRIISAILVQMEKPTEYSVSSEQPNVLPFTPLTCKDKKYLGKFHRAQIPLRPAFATTTHKAQGITAKHGVVLLPSAGTPFCRGLAYVGISRATHLHKLHLLRNLRIDHFTSGTTCKATTAIRKEYARFEELYPTSY